MIWNNTSLDAVNYKYLLIFYPYILSFLTLCFLLIILVRIKDKNHKLLKGSKNIFKKIQKLKKITLLLLIIVPTLAVLSLFLSPLILQVIIIFFLLFASFRLSNFFEVIYLIQKQNTLSTIGYIFLGIVWPIRFLGIVLTLLIIKNSFMFSDNFDLYFSYIIQILIILSWMYFLDKLIKSLQSYFLKRQTSNNRKNIDATTSQAITLLLQAVLIVFGSIAILRVFYKGSLSAIIAGIGIGGAALALASQDILKNIFGGITLMLDKPFKIGDRVQISDTDGTVEKVGFRSTRIRLLNGQLTTLPNQIVANTSVNNTSERSSIRRDIQLVLELSTSSEKIETLINNLKNYFFDKYLLNEINNTEYTPIIFFEDILPTGFLIKIIYRHNTVDYNEFTQLSQTINLRIIRTLELLNITLTTSSHKVFLEQ